MVACGADILDRLYAAALGDEMEWQVFLRTLAALLPNGIATLFYHDADAQEASYAINSGLDDGLLTRFTSTRDDLNPWMRPASVRRVGVGVVSDQMLPRAVLTRSTFYNEFLKPQQLEGAVGITIAREGRISFLCGIFTGESDANGTLAATHTLTALHPHLLRAFRFHRSAATRSGYWTMLGAIHQCRGLVVTEGRKLGSTIGDLGRDGLGMGASLDRAGRVRFDDPQADAVLSQLLKRSHGGPKIVRHRNRHGLHTFVRTEKNTIIGYFEGPTVIVLSETVVSQDTQTLAASLGERAGLTHAERRVLQAVFCGRTLVAMADDFGVSTETVRTQLKRIYAKCGVHGRVDLIRHASGLR